MVIKKDFKYSVQSSNSEVSETVASLTLTLPDNNSRYLLHRAIVKQNYGRLQGTSSTKTRSEVRGGGKKPWNQKGTGKARAGSSNSSLWRGGGVTFGPKPTSGVKKMNIKEWRLALHSAIQLQSDSITVISDNFFDLEHPSTKNIKSLIQQIDFSVHQNILIISSDRNAKLILSTRNLANVTVVRSNALNVRSFLLADKIICTESGLKNLQQVYN